MYRVSLVVLYFFIACTSILANVGDLEFKSLSGIKKEVDPGLNVNVVVMVTNLSDTSKEIRIQLKNKEDNIKLIANYSSFRIEKKSKVNKILGIQIPGNYKAGDVAIELEAFEGSASTPFDTVTIPLYIKPRYEISVNKPKTPSFLFAGDTANISYLIQNLSNMEIVVKVTIIEGLKSNVATLKIPKDSSVVYKYLFSVPKNLTSYCQQSFMLTAGIIEKQETEKSVYSSVEVFPTTNLKFDRYERFPVSVAAFGLISNRLGKAMYTTMYDVKGSGPVNKNKDKILNFHLRGPDRTGNPLYGLNDLYFMKYSTPHLDVFLGDYNFGLSELTESSRNGRGVKLQFKQKNWIIGSYYNVPRYYPLITNVYSAFSSYSFNTNNKISIGFLTKKDSTNNNIQLVTFSANNKPFKWLNTNLELAGGKDRNSITKAYKGGITIQNSIFSCNANYLYADPKFSGFVANSTRFFSGLSFQLKKLNISFNYDLNSTNYAMDTVYANMPYSKNFNGTASLRISQNNILTLGGYIVVLKDKSSKPLFDYTTANSRFSFQSTIRKLNVTLMGDVGTMTNRLIQSGEDNSLIYNGTLTMGYSLSQSFNINAFGTLQGGQKSVTGSKLFYYGSTMMVNLNNRFSLSVQYNSDYEWQYYTSDRSLLSLSLNGRINTNNEISVTADYNLVKNTLDKKEYNVQFRYTHTFNLPVYKKKDVGTVVGKIINHGVERVSGIRLNLNGVVTITDKEGNFKFPVIPVGTYVLGIDASSFGLNAITETAGPYEITVLPAKLTKFQFAMTKSARIEGKIKIQEDVRAGQKGYIPIKEQVERLIVEASNGTDVFRVFSDKDGTFIFEDLRPGSWIVKIYPNGLPQGYELATNQQNVNLVFGKQESIEFIILKKARQIKFQTTINK